MTYPEQIEALLEEINGLRMFVDDKDKALHAANKIAALSLLEGKRQQHEKIVAAVDNAVAHHPHPTRRETEFDEPEIRGQKFGEAAGINWAKHQIVKVLSSLTPRESGE